MYSNGNALRRHAAISHKLLHDLSSLAVTSLAVTMAANTPAGADQVSGATPGAAVHPSMHEIPLWGASHDAFLAAAQGGSVVLGATPSAEPLLPVRPCGTTDIRLKPDFVATAPRTSPPAAPRTSPPVEYTDAEWKEWYANWYKHDTWEARNDWWTSKAKSGTGWRQSNTLPAASPALPLISSTDDSTSGADSLSADTAGGVSVPPSMPRRPRHRLPKSGQINEGWGNYVPGQLEAPEATPHGDWASSGLAAN